MTGTFAGAVRNPLRRLAALVVLCGWGCSPPSNDAPAEGDPNALSGELVTYVADFADGRSERRQVLRTDDGRELGLDFAGAPQAPNGSRVQVWGASIGSRVHVSRLEMLAPQRGALTATEPDTYAAPTQDTYALVLVDLGGGVDKTAAQALKALFSTTPADKSFASYYNESSYGKYNVSGEVIGPFPFSMTTCDTTGMYKAIEPMITGTYKHLIYYFSQSSLCDFGGLGEEGSSAKPAKRTWMNGSLSCVVLMQEPGHNLGLMHANTMKCGTNSFSTTPATSCTITEYGSTMTTMGGGCKQLNAYERWYMQWLTGCNGVRVPASGTFNLLPLENSCPGGVQVLQVPFPATLAVTDPQAATTTVNLKNYYVELRTTGGIFDAFGTAGRAGGVTFTAPTVFVYASDDVINPATAPRGVFGNSVWTELLNMTPSGTSFTGLTAAGQSFTDPAGGATITLQAISATGATIVVTNANGTGSPTCIDGTTLTAPGPTACDGAPSGTAGTSGTAGASGSGGALSSGGTSGTGATMGSGAKGSGGVTGSGGALATSSGGATASGSGGAKGSGGTTSSGGTSMIGTGGRNGTGGSNASSGGTSGGSGGGSGSGGTNGTNEVGGVTGGCSCSTSPGSSGGWGSSEIGLVGFGLVALLRRRRGGRQPRA